MPPPPPTLLPPMPPPPPTPPPPPPPPSLTTKNQNQNQPSTLYFNKIDDPVGGVTAVQLNQKKDNQTQSTTISNLPAGDYTVGIKTPAPIKSTFCDDGRTLDLFTVIPNKKTTCVVYTESQKILPSTQLPPQKASQPLLPPPPKAVAPKTIEVLPMSVLYQEGQKTIALTFFNSADRAVTFRSSFGNYLVSLGETTTFELPQRTYEVAVNGENTMVTVDNKEVSSNYFTINLNSPTKVLFQRPKPPACLKVPGQSCKNQCSTTETPIGTQGCPGKQVCCKGPTHLECKPGKSGEFQCALAVGAGDNKDDCSTVGEDCSRKVCDATSLKCSLVKGKVGDPDDPNCVGVGKTCKNHLECNPTKKVCERVIGDGPNEDGCKTAGAKCEVKYSCNKDTLKCEKDSSGSYTDIKACEKDCTHLACSGMACIKLGGPPKPGETKCGKEADPSSDCSHLACNANQKCERVPGGGGNKDGCTTEGANCKSKYKCNASTMQCAADPSGNYSDLATCEKNCSHLACSGKACVKKAGPIAPSEKKCSAVADPSPECTNYVCSGYACVEKTGPPKPGEKKCSGAAEKSTDCGYGKCVGGGTTGVPPACIWKVGADPDPGKRGCKINRDCLMPNPTSPN